MAINQPPQSRPPSGAPNGGKIVSQTSTTENGPDGKPTRGTRVTFRTGADQIGSVFIPDSEYQEAGVLATVRAAANRIDALHNAEF